uniref:SUEL-type lectin domain-containing protein n=1 Tax=Rhodnius prolixus TaxID=13249 RepID=T1HIH7_RHOPR
MSSTGSLGRNTLRVACLDLKSRSTGLEAKHRLSMHDITSRIFNNFARVKLLLMYGHAEHPRYDTAYACEGKTLQIECKDGELINLIRANYGRFSITICNDHGNTEWSVNCMSPKSLRVLHARCSQQQNCSIQNCKHGNVTAALTTTTSRPSPPWLITSQPSVWSTAKVVTIRGPVGGTPAPGPPPLHVPGPTTARSVLGVTTGKNVAAEPTNRPSTASTVHAALTTSLPTDQPTVPSSTAPPGTPPPARLTDPPPTQPTQPSTTQPPGSLHATRKFLLPFIYDGCFRLRSTSLFGSMCCICLLTTYNQ